MASPTVEAIPVERAEFAGTWRHRIPIFITALVIRCVAGAVFFGSVDLINCAINTLALWAGIPVNLPYFPTVNALLWFGGALSSALHMPLPLALKLAPIFFDSLLAVLIYDLVSRAAPRNALRAGLLYATSPVALLITGFHCQWDSIALFFLMLAFGLRLGCTNTRNREFLFGALLAASLLVKPIALPFLALLPRRKGNGEPPEWPSVAGLASALGAGFLVCAAFGYSPQAALARIGLYSVAGVQVFGLPFAPGLAHISFLSHRLLWISPTMLMLAILYHRRKLAAWDVMLLFYLLSVATAGLSPQYLLWPVPLLLATNRLRLTAAYSAVATLFLLLYYMNPWASYFAFENLGTFAPLRGFAWLLPPAVLAQKDLLPVVHALGNVVFPVCAFVAAIFVWRSRGRMLDRQEAERGQAGWPLRHAGWYAAPAVAFGVAILCTKFAIDEKGLRPRLFEVWKAIPDQYALHVQSLNPSVIFVGNFGGFTPLNIVVLLAMLGIGWSLVGGLTPAVEKLGFSGGKGQPEDAAESPIS